MSLLQLSQQRHERQQSDAAAWEIPAECKRKIHHGKNQALEQAAQQGWVISTLGDIQNSDGQVSEKPALTLKLILLGARCRTRQHLGVPSSLSFAVMLKEFPSEKSWSPPHKPGKKREVSNTDTMALQQMNTYKLNSVLNSVYWF